MPHSLVKYAQTQKKTADGRQLFWGRAEQDGLPFRGIQPPVMPDEEYESRAVRVADVKNGIFDVTIPEQNAEYVKVLDACINGWYKCLHVERFVNKEPNLVQVKLVFRVIKLHRKLLAYLHHQSLQQLHPSASHGSQEVLLQKGK